MWKNLQLRLTGSVTYNSGPFRSANLVYMWYINVDYCRPGNQEVHRNNDYTTRYTMDLPTGEISC